MSSIHAYNYLSTSWILLNLLYSQLLLLLPFVITTLLTIQIQSTLSTNTCPSMCSCIWRNGKQTALCEKKSLISIPSGISSMTQVINLNKNNFQILPSKVFQERGLINLQKLFLAECKLGMIADDTFTQLTNLIELDLNTNLLTHVPTKSLNYCFNLRRLQLNHNPIQIIRAESFLTLTHLKSLDLSDAQIDLIESSAFRGLEKLEFLKLDNNRLTTLSISVVSDLPPLYSFDLHRNPWNCDCDLRASREWMLRYNVPQSIPPTCQTPQRVSGLMWNSLDIDDFACAPHIMSAVTEVTKYVFANATLSCVVKGLPEPKIFWYVDNGFYKNLTSHLVSGEKFFLVEEKNEGTINSVLTITGLDESDSQSFICSAENRAGISIRNFTLSVIPFPFGHVSGWTKVEVAGGIAGLLILLIFVFVLVIILLIRSRRESYPTDDKQSPICVLKNLSTGVKVESLGIKSHVTIIGKDGNEKNPENGNTSYGYDSGGMIPDLTKIGFNMNGFDNNICESKYIGNQFSNQMQINYQNKSQILAGNNCLTQLSPEISQNYNYKNYQQVYDADGFCTGLPLSVAATAFPPNYNYENFENDNSHRMTLSEPQHYQHKCENNYLHQESLPTPSNSAQNQWKISPEVMAPTVVRYSPDEGYAEESAPFHLEGTEV